MNLFLILLALAGDPADCPMHAQHMAAAAKAKEADSAQHDDHASHAAHGVDQRGDRMMGFSHEKTTHSFRLFADGGAIEVRANDAADAESVAAIRGHLQEIAKEFSAGTFSKPEAIHARTPDGVVMMKELGAAITYQYEELEGGARVRVRTKDARGIDAVHQFLRFQISDHRTGDSGKIEELSGT
jgi:hypothetical protein